MMSTAPSVVNRRPLNTRSRALTSSPRTRLCCRSKRSCTAVATLLTFCPPGPEARRNDTASSWSGICNPAAIGSGTASPLRSLVGCLVDTCSGSGDRCTRVGARRARLEQPGLLLRHRNLHAMRAEDAPDRAIDVRADIVDAIHRVRDPEADLEAHAVVLETDETRNRRRIVQDARVIFGRLDQQFQRHLGIVLVAHHHR